MSATVRTMSGEGSSGGPRIRVGGDPTPPAGDPAPSDDARARVAAEPSILEKLKASPVTAILSLVNIAVFAWAASTGDTQTNGVLLKFGAVEPLHVWSGQYWRVATCMFMHIGVIHLVWNTYAGAGWSAAIERALGKWRFLFVYLASGIAGGCVSVLGAWLVGKGHISAGASGAMFGMVGATFAIRLYQLGTFKALFADKFFRANAVNIGIWTMIGLSLRVDNWAHGGGLVCGAVATWLLVSRASRAKWVVFAIGFVAVVLGATRPWHAVTNEDACRLYPENLAMCVGVTPLD